MVKLQRPLRGSSFAYDLTGSREDRRPQLYQLRFCASLQ
jgi:hypothetical protein